MGAHVATGDVPGLGIMQVEGGGRKGKLRGEKLGSGFAITQPYQYSEGSGLSPLTFDSEKKITTSEPTYETAYDCNSGGDS